MDGGYIISKAESMSVLRVAKTHCHLEKILFMVEIYMKRTLLITAPTVEQGWMRRRGNER